MLKITEIALPVTDGLASPKVGRYIPALDGLRALSIVFVLYAHSLGSLPERFRHGYSLGLAGVNIFFVISGYLITSQLMAEKDRSGTIHIGRFMLRRIFRLLPASFLLIGVTIVLNYLGLVRLTSAELFHALTYTMDYYHSDYRPLEHLWSLSVEEQFYVLWPFLMLALAPARLRIVCLLAAILCPVIRAWAWYAGGIDHTMIFRRFEMVADTIAFGCLLALLKDRMPKWTCSTMAAVICLCLIVLDCTLIRNMNNFQIVQISVNSIAAAILIHSLTNRNLVISRWFAWRPLVWLGTISYSLYLWQPPFLAIPAPLFPVNGFLPLKLACSVLVASASYYLVERPIRDLGKRFQPRLKLPARVSVSNTETVAQ